MKQMKTVKLAVLWASSLGLASCASFSAVAFADPGNGQGSSGNGNGPPSWAGGQRAAGGQSSGSTDVLSGPGLGALTGNQIYGTPSTTSPSATGSLLPSSSSVGVLLQPVNLTSGTTGATSPGATLTLPANITTGGPGTTLALPANITTGSPGTTLTLPASITTSGPGNGSNASATVGRPTLQLSTPEVLPAFTNCLVPPFVPTLDTLGVDGVKPQAKPPTGKIAGQEMLKNTVIEDTVGQPEATKAQPEKQDSNQSAEVPQQMDAKQAN